MSAARDLVYSFVNKQVAAEEQIKSGSDDDLYLHGLLNQVEDDRAHAEAEKLRELAGSTRLNLLDPHAITRRELVKKLADEIDPYEMRDGNLVRKSDGKPVIL